MAAAAVAVRCAGLADLLYFLVLYAKRKPLIVFLLITNEPSDPFSCGGCCFGCRRYIPCEISVNKSEEGKEGKKLRGKERARRSCGETVLLIDSSWLDERKRDEFYQR